MAALIARKANPLLPFLTWRTPGFHNIRNFRRLGIHSSARPNHSDPEAATGIFREEFEIGSQEIMLKTKEIACNTDGAVEIIMGGTHLLSAVTYNDRDGPQDFLPLTVNYQEPQWAQCQFPTNYMRREGAPKERELLCGRIIDRPIRPLFPPGFYHDVQVEAKVLSSDGTQDPDILAANATSAALMLSEIPWGGPIGVIRIGRIDGRFVINPSVDELILSDLNLVYACTRDKTMMIDVQAREISERDLKSALRFAHPEAVKYIEPQIRLAAKAGKPKKEFTLSMISERTLEKVRGMSEESIEAVFTDPSYGKFERGKALDNITKKVKRLLQEEGDEESLKLLPKTVDTVRKKVVRRNIIEKGLRVDGRRLDEVRPLHCKCSYLPTLHGSSIFSRGDTQVLCTVTLGAPGDAQRLDSIVGPPTKRFMLHYSFPPFSINEVGKRGGLNRREVGHGTLAEKALLAVLPPEDDFPYTVRVNSEVMASDGSTSMATVCGGSLALMDAGISVREHVAGVSVGLVTEVDPDTGIIKDYRILTDILGLEDHLGDMDFKIAGTRKGVTAIQLDIKPAGIPLDIVCESLEPALKGRLQILDHMERHMNAPRTQDERNSPRLVTKKYSNESLRRLIGPQAVLLRKIEETTGARLSVSDGTLTMLARNQSIMDKAQDMVDSIIGREIEVGEIYKGVVSSVKEYGAFVEFNGGQQGLLHISELSHQPVSRVSDVVSVGQQLSLRCIGLDVRGNIKLSLKATLPRSEEKSSASEDSVALKKEKPNVWASISDIPGDVEKQDMDKSFVSEDENQEDCDSSSSQPSAVQCDEEENSLVEDRKFDQTLDKTAKASRSKKVPALNQKSKSVHTRHSKAIDPLFSDTPSVDEILNLNPDKSLVSEDENKEDCHSSSPAFLIRSAVECDEEEKSFARSMRPIQTLDKASKTSKTKKILTPDHKSKTVSARPKKTNNTLFSGKLISEIPTPNKKDEHDIVKTGTCAESLKLGDRVNGKVLQIRPGGIVLDLGGGIRGMYRFKENSRKDFEIGEEIRVGCTSFSSKGIPVMSLLED